MKIEHFENHEALSQRAADMIIEEIKNKKNLLMCAATGKSPTLTYALLNQEFQKSPGLFSELKIIKLDEWGNVPMDLEGTCETYLQEHMIRSMKIPSSRYISFRSDAPDPSEECNRIQALINRYGGIDLCILGLGKNGHIGLNEPAQELQLHCHVARLASTTLTHPMASGMTEKPPNGYTIGMKDILDSRKIILIIHGSGKQEIVRDLISGTISTRIPASFLWLHPDTVCLTDLGNSDG